MTPDMYNYYFPELYADPMKPGRAAPFGDGDQLYANKQDITWPAYDQYRKTKGWLHKSDK